MTVLEQSSRVLSLPPAWLNMYSDFIIKNASAVSQIESGLRSLTYIIPGRFRESEIASESLHSGVQLLSLYHDSLLAKSAALLPQSQRPPPSPHTRYTKFWKQQSGLYRGVALTVQVVQYTELLVEMAARRRGEKTRWRVVVILEAVKALCRLILLRITGRRMMLSPPLPEREPRVEKLEDSSFGSEFDEDSLSEQSSRVDETRWSMPRTGLSLPALPDAGDISNYLLSKVLTADDIKPPKALLHRITSAQGEIAEVLYILRPLIYALACQRWRGDKKSWYPWLLGLSIEYGSRQLAKRDFQERLAGGLRGLTGLEKEELRKRAWNLGWWAMRGAFYENITKYEL